MLVNPNARRGPQALEVIDRLAAGGVDVDAERFSDPSEVSADIVRRAAETDLVIVCGGDGTVAAAARGLLEARLPMGVLPLGTANDLARWGFPSTSRRPPTRTAHPVGVLRRHRATSDLGIRTSGRSALQRIVDCGSWARTLKPKLPGDDVLLDLGRAPIDRLGAGVEVTRRPGPGEGGDVLQPAAPLRVVPIREERLCVGACEL